MIQNAVFVTQNIFFGNQMPLKLNTFHVPMYPAVCVGHIWKRGPTSVIDTFCQ